MLPVNHRQTVHPNGTLMVENVQQKADQGTYTCEARNRQGLSDKGSVDINVMGKLHEKKIMLVLKTNNKWISKPSCQFLTISL
jgi:hypothetical protein